MKALRLDVGFPNTRLVARQVRMVGVMVLMVLMPLTACRGSAKRDLTQPLFWTPEAVPTTQESAAAFSNPPSGSPERTATATPWPSVSPTFTPPSTSTPTPSPEPSTRPTFVPSDTPTPSPTPSATAVTDPTATPTPSATILPTATATPVATPTPSPTATPTPTASSTPLPTPTETPRSRTTTAPTDTPAPNSATLRGRILRNGAPPEGMVTLTLEDQAYHVLREIEVTGGDYRFENLPASVEGYNVVFAQASNSQFNVEDVVSWAWIGPLPVQDGAVVDVPDLEIGLLGLIQTNPPPDAFVDAVTPQDPITLAWTPYPEASRYWVELYAGRTLQRLWQSDAVGSTSVVFDGILDNGEALTPGTYWWRVGAEVDGIAMTLSGTLEGFTVRP